MGLQENVIGQKKKKEFAMNQIQQVD